MYRPKQGYTMKVPKCKTKHEHKISKIRKQKLVLNPSQVIHVFKNSLVQSEPFTQTSDWIKQRQDVQFVILRHLQGNDWDLIESDVLFLLKDSVWDGMGSSAIYQSNHTSGQQQRFETVTSGKKKKKQKMVRADPSLLGEFKRPAMKLAKHLDFIAIVY